MKRRVLFLCTANAVRSQMAEGILRHLAGERYDAASAGHRPTAVDPLAVDVLRERGVDISSQRSKDVREFLGEEFDHVVTLCGDDAPGSCPFFPGGKRYVHVPFPDPAQEKGTEEERRAAFRRVRDALWEWIVREFVEGGER
ncbi:MAG: arsenate reductase ArsC [Candidatus Bipolaricaulota bacterium]